MAGRCISVTHEALGTVRVMKTGGMIGEVVGKAASIALKNGATPREVYERYFGELKELLDLHGAARREDLDGPISLPDDSFRRRRRQRRRRQGRQDSILQSCQVS